MLQSPRLHLRAPGHPLLRAHDRRSLPRFSQVREELFTHNLDQYRSVLNIKTRFLNALKAKKNNSLYLKQHFKRV